MRFAVTKGEKNINDLAARVFGLSPTADSGRLKQAADTLLKTNPHLANLQNVPAGTVVVVQDTADVRAVATQGPVQSAAAAAVALVQQNLRQLTTAFDEGLNVETADIKATSDSIQNAQVQSAAANNPPLKDQLAKVSSDLDARSGAAKTSRALQQQLLTQVDSDLSDLLKRLG